MAEPSPLQLAMAALRDGQPAQATALLTTHLSDAPDDALAWLFLGVAQGQIGQDAPAETSLRRAAELAPGDPRPRYNLGRLYQRGGRTDEARTAYAAALALDPRHIKARTALDELPPAPRPAPPAPDSPATVDPVGDRYLAELDAASLARVSACLGLVVGGLAGAVQIAATLALAQRLGGPATVRHLGLGLLQPVLQAVALALVAVLGAVVYNARAARHRRIRLQLARQGSLIRLTRIDAPRFATGYVWWHLVWPLMVLPLMLVLAVLGFGALVAGQDDGARAGGLVVCLLSSLSVPVVLGLLYLLALLAGLYYNLVASLTGGLAFELSAEGAGWRLRRFEVLPTALTLFIVALPLALVLLALMFVLASAPHQPPWQRAAWAMQALSACLWPWLPWVKVPLYNGAARRVGSYGIWLADRDGG